MEVARGYKQTDAGFIPEDWDVVALGSISETSSGTTPPRALAQRYYRNGDIAWVKTLDLNNAEIYSTEEQITQAALKETSLKIYPPGSVLVAMYGGFNQIGRTGLLRIPATVNQALTAVRPEQNRLRPEFLLSVLNYRVGYWKSVASSSRKDPNITSQDVQAFPVQLPSPPEQDAIACVLQEADSLIDALTLLLAKKRNMKRGAMQELLTGKRRLPGFTEPWDVKSFSELVQLRTERVAPSRIGVQEFCVELEHVEQETGHLIGHTATDEQSSLKSLFRKDDVLFGKLRVYLRKYWLATREGVCSTEFWVLTARPSAVTPEFLFQLVKTDGFVDAASSSYGTHMPRSDWNVVKKYEVKLPSPKEQEAIADVLDDMDVEIVALEARIAKARQMKQGMMQELLTGRIRLV